MNNRLKFIISCHFKGFRKNQKNSGFTLIELLVAMLMAVLIITPLLGFMVDVLSTDRKEQAKSTTEQEIQTALDFIARDLQQAVYIYDADGLTRDPNADASLSGIKNQIPPKKQSAANCNSSNEANCQPVLVFWKREFIPNSVGINSSTETQPNQTDDGFAYSLVAYYLINNPPGNSFNRNWSPSARIGRFQVRGQVISANANNRANTNQAGFAPPPLDLTVTANSLKERMNRWVAATTPYDQRVETLVDFISVNPSASTSSFTCPSGGQLVGNSASGFFACVNANEVSAQVFIRGNAYVRLNNNNNISVARNPGDSAFFPTVNMRVQGRSFLFSK
ncbi:MAG: hormogonium polysaccharide secretion pseudopilin HpsC [Scytonematopsis contorta HA4267-MV1]|jgi:prepilin-type N-terminal cleavage/methylation domain-containing protein|nr:hormogonium polysaccharide secretion pseudopilin HpsC [Scytonematopsis contorta HA4267-MV1]